MARFPTVEALAAATPADVLRAWQGLGYNRRALNLWRAARRSSTSTAARCPRTSPASRRCRASGRTRPGRRGDRVRAAGRRGRHERAPGARPDRRRRAGGPERRELQRLADAAVPARPAGGLDPRAHGRRRDASAGRARRTAPRVRLGRGVGTRPPAGRGAPHRCPRDGAPHVRRRPVPDDHRAGCAAASWTASAIAGRRMGRLDRSIGPHDADRRSHGAGPRWRVDRRARRRDRRRTGRRLRDRSPRDGLVDWTARACAVNALTGRSATLRGRCPPPRALRPRAAPPLPADDPSIFELDLRGLRRHWAAAGRAAGHLGRDDDRRRPARPGPRRARRSG